MKRMRKNIGGKRKKRKEWQNIKFKRGRNDGRK